MDRLLYAPRQYILASCELVERNDKQEDYIEKYVRHKHGDPL